MGYVNGNDAMTITRTSSGVTFEVEGGSFWRIRGQLYDLTDFVHVHPGGSEVLYLARDRFGDATSAVEAHHLDFRRVRRVLERYRVRGPRRNPEESTSSEIHDALRDRMLQALRRAGAPKGGPTRACLAICGSFLAMWMCLWAVLFYRGTFAAALMLGACSAIVGAFGHNFVHQPRFHLLARACLDCIGLSADVWRREHVLQHHMYTNTPKDNHWLGTAPFFIVDPHEPRSFLQRSVFPAMAPVLLCFGIVVNYLARVRDVGLRGERLSSGEVVLPLQLALLATQWGAVKACMLLGTSLAVTGVWYFSIALTNHNSRSAIRAAVHRSDDWAVQQIASCTDWSTGLLFPWNLIFLMLNQHTVHHVFPSIDASRLHIAQRVLEEVCRDFNVEYDRFPHFGAAYLESLALFAHGLRSGE